MTIRSSTVARYTALVILLVATPVLLFIVIGPIQRGKPLLAATPLVVLIALAVFSLVRRWPLTTLTVDADAITVKRAGKTTVVPRRNVHGLAQPNPSARAPVEFVDEHGHTLIKLADPFRQEDLEKVATYLGLEIQ